MAVQPGVLSSSVHRHARSYLEDMARRLRRTRERTSMDPRRLSGTSNHYAVLINARNKVEAAAWNAAATPSKGRGASRYTMHAEMNALSRVRDMHKLSGCTLVVTRFTSYGDMAESKPCRECQSKLTLLMRRYGLKGGTLHVTGRQEQRPTRVAVSPKCTLV